MERTGRNGMASYDNATTHTPFFSLSWADRGRLRSSLACNTLVPSLFLLICLVFFPSLTPSRCSRAWPSFLALRASLFTVYRLEWFLPLD